VPKFKIPKFNIPKISIPKIKIPKIDMEKVKVYVAKYIPIIKKTSHWIVLPFSWFIKSKITLISKFNGVSERKSIAVVLVSIPISPET
jgi:hypothetical protein